MVNISELVSVTAPWRTLFNNSAPVQMVVVGTHVLSMLVAAGLALAHDRGTWRVSREAPAIRSYHLTELGAVHRPVAIALAICIASGLALFASDVHTYVFSLTFWLKMGLIVLLFANAIVMTKSESILRGGGGAAVVAWSRIRTSAVVSAGLWATIVAVSVVLSLEK